MCEQPRHVRRRFQIAFGIDLQQSSSLIHRYAQADRGQHIMQRPCGAIGIERVVDCKDWHAALPGQGALFLKPALVLAPSMHQNAKPDPVRRKLFQAAHYRVQIGGCGFNQPKLCVAIGVAICDGIFMRVGFFGGRLRQYDEQQILQISGQIIEAQYAPALVGTHIADR